MAIIILTDKVNGKTITNKIQYILYKSQNFIKFYYENGGQG